MVFLKALGLLCLIAAFAGVLVAAVSVGGARTGMTANPAAVTATRTFTLKEFDAYARQRTKAQIREEFGSPDSVTESRDEWYYSSRSERLVVVDPNAGIQVAVNIVFTGPMTGEDGARDAVLTVEY